MSPPPAQQAGADAAGRPKPQMVVHTPIVLSEDQDAIRAAAKRQFGFYQRLPYYSQMLQDAGYDEAAGRDFTDRMADALIISGSDNEIADRVRAMHDDYGVDEMLAAMSCWRMIRTRRSTAPARCSANSRRSSRGANRRLGRPRRRCQGAGPWLEALIDDAPKKGETSGGAEQDLKSIGGPRHLSGNHIVAPYTIMTA